MSEERPPAPMVSPQAAVVLGVLACGLFGWKVVLPRVTSSGAAPAVNLALDPEQTALDPPVRVTVVRGGRTFTIEKTHRYVVSGRVLKATAYDLTWTNDFFDVDVGVIWGSRLDEYLQRFKFTQMGRWLFWRTEGPISDEDRDDITRHLSNNHLIPAEGRSRIARAIRWVDEGDHVRIVGALVRVLDDSGRLLGESSTTRDDTGDGACEVIWVDRLELNGRVYE